MTKYPQVRRNSGKARVAMGTVCDRCHEAFGHDEEYIVKRMGLGFYYSHPVCPQAEPDSPEEGDYTTQDHVRFYQYGRLAVVVPEGDSIRQALQEHMDREGYFPNVWFISDHGNAHLMTLDD